MVLKNEPTLIAGDFNTTNETYQESGELPYPEEYGTLFGLFNIDFGLFSNPIL
jgi:endonuclease/exonuclease/phosphatase family metal-dependent hydrolase